MHRSYAVKETKGFTLIELLVVIAIIGILSSVVLASLNTARNKATDVNIMSNLAGTRSEAELYYSNNNSYNGLCAVTGTAVIGDQITAADVSFDGIAPTYDNSTEATASDGQCHATSSSWAATVPMKGGGFFCVDADGAATTTAALAADAFVCP
jgi:prepilin-type N-terminal cleavage/methylation domain-containing protein